MNFWRIHDRELLIDTGSTHLGGHRQRKPKSAECMRFLLRFILLGGILLALFLLAFALQQHSLKYRSHPTVGNTESTTVKVQKEPTEEDREVRRLLLLAGSSPDEGVPVPQVQPSAGLPQLENAVGAGLLFPIGRYPNGGQPINGQLTLNVAVVLVVSLLSIAVLITAICCVIVIALAMDSATSPDGQRSSSASADFLLSSWPQLMLPQQLDPQMAKLFRPDPFYGANDSPPLTEDEMDEDLMELGVGHFNRDADRAPLMSPVEGPETGGISWPAMGWNQEEQQRQEIQEWDNGDAFMARRNSFTV